MVSEAGYDALAVSLIKAARLSVCAQTEGVAASRASGMHRVTQSTPLFSRRAQSKLRQTSNALIRLLCARNVNRKSTLAQERKSVRVERGKGGAPWQFSRLSRFLIMRLQEKQDLLIWTERHQKRASLSSGC